MSVKDNGKPRYIDANKIAIHAPILFSVDGGECFISTTDVQKAIAMTPTEDVVKVVRCKDCTFYCPYQKPVEDFDGKCIVRNCETDEEVFCSYGERKEKV